MKPSMVSSLLAAYLKNRKRVLLVGPPGIGKSDIIETAVRELGYDLAVWHPVVSDPTDFRGLPFKANGHAEFLPFGDLRRLIDATEPLVVFLDDIGQAPRSVQAAAMQLLLTGRIADHHVSEHVRFVAATNRAQDRAGVSGVLQPLQGRFHAIVDVQIDLDDWCAWAYDHGMPDELIAFLRMREGLLHSWEPLSEIKPQPTPRTWQFCGEAMQLGLAGEEENQAILASVGDEAGGQLITFLKLARDSRIDLDAMLKDPKGCEIPTDPGLRYVVCTGLARRASVKNIDEIRVILERLDAAGGGEFAILCLRDAMRRDTSLQDTEAWTEIALGKIGELLAPQSS